MRCDDLDIILQHLHVRENVMINLLQDIFGLTLGVRHLQRVVDMPIPKRFDRGDWLINIERFQDS